MPFNPRDDERSPDHAYDLSRELRELIAALDARMPHVERAGEEAIARDAAALREKAVQRLRALVADSEIAPQLP